MIVTAPEQAKSQMWTTKRLGIMVLITFFFLLIVRHLIVNGTASGVSRYQILHANPLTGSSNPEDAPVASPENTQAVAVPADASNSKDSGNSSLEGFQWLDTWNHMKQLTNVSIGLPHANEAINDAKTCGLVAGSSVTVIGTPGSLSGNFWLDLVGTALPGESEKPIVLQYNVRLTGDKLTEGPVIVQNAFTATNGWGYEDRCPYSNSNNATAVDDLERCNSVVDREENSTMNSKHHTSAKEGGKPSKYFPFKQGYLAIATLRIGLEGIHMTADGKHVTSFAYRAGLEPWFVTEVRISGDFKLISAIASGLPTSEDLENSLDLEMLKSSPVPDGKDIDLLIGIFSTANNFKRRMMIRRTWMQYDAVRRGAVAVRFFVGLILGPMASLPKQNFPLFQQLIPQTHPSSKARR